MQIPIWLGDKDFINAGTDASLPLTLSTEQWEIFLLQRAINRLWLLQLKRERKLVKLLINSDGGCTNYHTYLQWKMQRLGFVRRIGAALNYLFWGAPDSG